MLPIRTETLQKHSIWLSLLLHALLMATYLRVSSVSSPIKPKQPMPSYVPSYVSPTVPTSPAEPAQTNTPKLSEARQAKPLKPDKHGLEKTRAAPKTQRKKTVKAAPSPKQIAIPPAKRYTEEITNEKNREPMHLIGETNIIKPLIKILAKALSQHLAYPKIAQDFNLRGTVLVGFVLHPQGYVSDTKVVKSSGAGVLDDAAREAVNHMSPVPGVGEFMQKSEFLVVGIIFG